MATNCISVDWLQTYCLCNELEEGVYTVPGFRFQLQDTGLQSAQYKKIFRVKVGSQQVATICQLPRTEVINPRATSVKLENKVLYSSEYIKMLYAIHESFKMTYKGITRIDLCLDCNELAGGRQVHRFLRDYLFNEAGEKGHIVKRGATRFIVNGRRTSSSITEISAITWGSKKSAVHSYVYDKTLELIEVKDKPWIRKFWEDNGLEYAYSQKELDDMDDKEKQRKIERIGLSEFVKKKVWRWEISIKSEGQDILCMRSGELFKLSPNYLQHYSNIQRLYQVYAQKYFDFRENTGQKLIKNYKPIQLFEFAERVPAKPIKVCHFNDSGRTEKIAANLLNKLMLTYNDIADMYTPHISETVNFLYHLSGTKAGILKANKYQHYLDQFAAPVRFERLQDTYLHTVAIVGKRGIDIDPDELYSLFLQPEEEPFDPPVASLPAYDYPYYSNY